MKKEIIKKKIVLKIIYLPLLSKFLCIFTLILKKNKIIKYIIIFFRILNIINLTSNYFWHLMNTLASLFFENSHIYQDKTLFGFKDGKNWKTISWNKSKELVENIALGLHEIGVKKSDKISLIAENSYKWCVIDLSIMSLGAITVPGYTTSNEEEIFYLLSHSNSSFVFVNEKLLPVILKLLPKLKK